MSALPTSEYRRSFSWTLCNGYSRSFPPEHYKPSNILYRPDSLDFINGSSKMDHKAVAKKYMKLNPHLYGNGIPHETKSKYELSQSTYKDNFRKHASYPSVADYIQIANNVTDDHFPDSVKCFYDPEEFQKDDNSCKISNNLNAFHIPIPKSTGKVKKYEDFENHRMVPKKSTDPSSLPKITDLGARCYRNDLSPECMSKDNSIEEYVREANKKILNIIRRYEYERQAVKDPVRKPKRYIDLPVY